MDSVILTHSGRVFDFAKPHPDSFTVSDIAHGLSKTCRFAGQTNRFYSVANHSIQLSKVVPRDLALAALLHDASEAFTGDMPAPLKTLLPDFVEIERQIMWVVGEKFSIPMEKFVAVRSYDYEIFRYEIHCHFTHRVRRGERAHEVLHSIPTPDYTKLRDRYGSFYDRFPEEPVVPFEDGFSKTANLFLERFAELF